MAGSKGNARHYFLLMSCVCGGELSDVTHQVSPKVVILQLKRLHSGQLQPRTSLGSDEISGPNSQRDVALQ